MGAWGTLLPDCPQQHQPAGLVHEPVAAAAVGVAAVVAVGVLAVVDAADLGMKRQLPGCAGLLMLVIGPAQVAYSDC